MEETKRNFLIQNGVDVDTGIENTVDFDTYNELLLDFANSFPKEVNKFNAFKEAGDMVNYEIIVHALKSNCRTLGFSTTGEMFYQHELAGKENNTTYINNNFDSLISECNKVYGLLLNYKNRG